MNKEDKIKNLKEEVNKIIAESKEWESKYYNLQERIDKTCDYIKNEIWYCYGDGEIIDRIVILNLLNILNGDDE